MLLANCKAACLQAACGVNKTGRELEQNVRSGRVFQVCRNVWIRFLGGSLQFSEIPLLAFRANDIARIGEYGLPQGDDGPAKGALIEDVQGMGVCISLHLM